MGEPPCPSLDLSVEQLGVTLTSPSLITALKASLTADKQVGDQSDQTPPNMCQTVGTAVKQFVTRLLPLQRKSNGICSVLSGLIFYVLASTLFGLQSDDGISIQNNEGAC